MENDNNDNAAENDSEEETTEMSKEPITFTMYCVDPNPNYDEFQSPVAQKIKELTGVTLKSSMKWKRSKTAIRYMAAELS